MNHKHELEERVKTAQAECERLREENVRLRAMLIRLARLLHPTQDSWCGRKFPNGTKPHGMQFAVAWSRACSSERYFSVTWAWIFSITIAFEPPRS